MYFFSRILWYLGTKKVLTNDTLGDLRIFQLFEENIEMLFLNSNHTLPPVDQKDPIPSELKFIFSRRRLANGHQNKVEENIFINVSTA